MITSIRKNEIRNFRRELERSLEGYLPLYEGHMNSPESMNVATLLPCAAQGVDSSDPVKAAIVAIWGTAGQTKVVACLSIHNRE